MRSLPLVLAALVGCSSAPLPPRIEAARPAPTSSASSAPAPAIATAVRAAAPPNDAVKANGASTDPGDLVDGGARLALGDGAELVVMLGQPTAPEIAPTLTMALVRGGKVIARRDDFLAVTGVEAKLLTSAQSCETTRASLRRESFGSVEGVRVSLACAIGEDYSTSTELAVLFRLGGPLRDLDGLTRIWAGLAAREQNDMDSCLSSREVDFRMIGEKTLEKTITQRTRWVDQAIGGDVKSRLKKACKVGTSKRVERVTLP